MPFGFSLHLTGDSNTDPINFTGPKKRVTIGRSQNNDIILPFPSISRIHAELVNDEYGKWNIKDMGSSRGTLVNGNKIPTGQFESLKFGDLLILGNISIKFLEETLKTGEMNKFPVEINSSLEETIGKEKQRTNDSEYIDSLFSPEVMTVKEEMHREIVQDSKEIEEQSTDNEQRRKAVLKAIEDILPRYQHRLPSNLPLEIFVQAIMDEVLDYGPITGLLEDDSIDEIMINGPNKIFIERGGKLERIESRFGGTQHLRRMIDRIVEPLGKRVDEGSPYVDARLPNGSRVNIILQPLSIHGSSVTIRKFRDEKLRISDLESIFKTLSKEMALFLRAAVRARQNILVSGGTGSGKTTLLNALSEAIFPNERIITIEDSAELKLNHVQNLVSLESRPPSLEGKGEVTIRDLLINSLRMRPDRIVVGECRGKEAWDMLQAMNTGHEGSLTTIHANSPRDALLRLECMVMTAGFNFPLYAIRELISSAIDLIIHIARYPDGSRKISSIVEITGRDSGGKDGQETITILDLFSLNTFYNEDGLFSSEFVPCGSIPRFVELMHQVGNHTIPRSIFFKKESQ